MMHAPADPPIWQSNSLVCLAAKIQEEHAAAEAARGAAERAARKGIEHALACGDALIQARAQVPYGQWLPWLAENCPAVSERMAQYYMRITRNRPELESKSETVSDLTLQEAARLLTPDEPEPDPKPKPKPRPKPLPLTKDVTGEQLRIPDRGLPGAVAGPAGEERPLLHYLTPILRPALIRCRREHMGGR